MLDFGLFLHSPFDLVMLMEHLNILTSGELYVVLSAAEHKAHLPIALQVDIVLLQLALADMSAFGLQNTLQWRFYYHWVISSRPAAGLKRGFQAVRERARVFRLVEEGMRGLTQWELLLRALAHYLLRVEYIAIYFAVPDPVSERQIGFASIFCIFARERESVIIRSGCLPWLF